MHFCSLHVLRNTSFPLPNNPHLSLVHRIASLASKDSRQQSICKHYPHVPSITTRSIYQAGSRCEVFTGATSCVHKSKAYLIYASVGVSDDQGRNLPRLRIGYANLGNLICLLLRLLLDRPGVYCIFLDLPVVYGGTSSNNLLISILVF